MKGTILTALAAGAVVLAGCAKIETTDVPEGRVIGFDNFVTNAVKSIDNAEALTTFFVYGGPTNAYTDFNGVEVTKTAGVYEYNPAQYWDESATYQFAAYSDENAKIVDNVSFVTDEGDNQYHLKIEDYTTDGSKDLVYAYTSDIQYATSNGTVTMDFRHILSKIIFRFSKNETLNGSTITISDVEIVSAKHSGDFTGKDVTGNQYDYTCWNNQIGEEAFSFDFASASKLTDQARSLDTNPELLIPQQTGSTLLQVKFKLTPSGTIANAPYNKEAETFTVDLPSVSEDHWNPGYVYVYSAVISAENFDLKPIVFDVLMTNEWEDETVAGSDILLDDAEPTV